MGQWVDDICDAFRQLGGEASYEELYPAIRSIRREPVDGEWRATVRRIIEDHSRDSANFRGTHLFTHVSRGRWRLDKVPRPAEAMETKMPPTIPTVTQPPFEAFRATWLEDVEAGNPTTVQLGQRFSEKIVGQWLDEDEATLDIVYCDGAGDGGIDIAILERGTGATDNEEVATGDTWYLIQSKY